MHSHTKSSIVKHNRLKADTKLCKTEDTQTDRHPHRCGYWVASQIIKKKNSSSNIATITKEWSPSPTYQKLLPYSGYPYKCIPGQMSTWTNVLQTNVTRTHVLWLLQMVRVSAVGKQATVKSVQFADLFKGDFCPNQKFWEMFPLQGDPKRPKIENCLLLW